MRQRHPDAGEDQERAEDVEDPLVGLDERRAGHDHHEAHGQRPDDAPEQDPVLVLGGHREGAEDQGEDEDVVDREALLDEVAGEVLDALGRAEPEEDEDAEADAQARPRRR